ncbi:MAG: hypothetical protein RL754_82 [Bacteroidota bacterium]|jgi:hypothetical protein
MLVFGLASLVLAGCGVQKNLPPEWIASKPIDAGREFVYGVGSSFVNPNIPYQNTAREAALSDMAQELVSSVSETSQFLQKENKLGYSSVFTSNVQSHTALKLSHYHQVESAVHEGRYYVLYKLDLEGFERAKAEREREAYAWINKSLAQAVSTEDSYSISQRYQFLVQALERAREEHLEFSNEYGVQIAKELFGTLQKLEQNIELEINFPEQLFYLGLAKPVKGTVRVRSSWKGEQDMGFKLESSSGSFEVGPNNSVFCVKTGDQERAELLLEPDWTTVVPNATLEQRNWLQLNSMLKAREIIRFEKTPLMVKGDLAVVRELEVGLAKKFELATEAPLELKVESKHYSTGSGSAIKHVIQVRYNLTNDQNQSIWSSQWLESKAISASSNSAVNSALQSMYEDFVYFILPQILRALDY